MNILRRQDGVASLVGVSLAAFLILVITISTASFMTGELQRSTDNADTTKAYYSAQSGAEAVITAIKAQLSNGANDNLPLSTLINQGCDTDTLASIAPNPVRADVNCRAVQATTAEAVDSLSNNKVVQYDLTNSPQAQNGNISELDLQWDMKNPPNGTSFPSPAATALYADEHSWDPTTPPVIELTVTNYFPGQPTTVDQTTNACAFGFIPGETPPKCSSGTIFLVPQWQTCPGGAACPGTVNYQLATQNSSPGTNGLQPLVYTGCTNAQPGGYRCSIALQNIAPAGYKTVVRMESRFGDASFDLKAKDNGGAFVQLPLQNALIDVTANIGTAYQRFQIAVPVRSGAYSGFDALYGDTSLCKDFDVLNDGTGLLAIPDRNGGCPFSP